MFRKCYRGAIDCVYLHSKGCVLPSFCKYQKPKGTQDKSSLYCGDPETAKAENCHALNGTECMHVEGGCPHQNKSPSPGRHTLDDGADATTDSGKSSGFIGGMR